MWVLKTFLWIYLDLTPQATAALHEKLFQYSQQIRLFVQVHSSLFGGVASGLQVHGTFKITSMLPPRKGTTYCKQMFVLWPAQAIKK